MGAADNKQAAADAELTALRAELEATKAAAAEHAKARAAAEKAAADAEALAQQAMSEKDAAQQALAEAAEQIRLRPLAPGAKAGAPIYLAKCEISNSGKPVLPGHPLPFDPTQPPKGFEGLIEGVHYEKR